MKMCKMCDSANKDLRKECWRCADKEFVNIKEWKSPFSILWRDIKNLFRRVKWKL